VSWRRILLFIALIGTLRRADARAYLGRGQADNIPSLVARYDLTSPSNYIISSGSSIELIADLSGNSATNVLALDAAASNYASFPALTAFGSGNFSVAATIFVVGNSVAYRVFGSAANGFFLSVDTAGTIHVGLQSANDLTSSTGTLSQLTKVVVGYTRSGTTGTYYINGASAGTITDSNNYLVGINELGATLSGTTGTVFNGLIYQARVYSTALSASAMAADAAGTVQSTCTFCGDFSLGSKLASTLTSSTAGGASVITITINTSGDLGARISGARDLVNLTSSHQPTLSGGGALFNGTSQNMQAPSFALVQPETVYLVGQHVTWGSAKYFFDGYSSSNSMALRDASGGSTPNIELTAGGSALGPNGGLVVATDAVVTSVFNTSSSLVEVNRTNSLTGTVGSNNAQGFTLGANGALGVFGNVRVKEVLVFSVVHDTATRNLVIAQEEIKWGLPNQ
jgi:concanavalin A-like lectin/glucanase superfamily protein